MKVFVMGTGQRWRHHFLWGMLLIAFGVLVLLDRSGLLELDIDLHRIWHFWPLLLVLFGLAEMVPPTTPRYLLSGLWNIFFAAWWYVSFEHLWGLGFGDTWPALLIAWGLGLVLRPLLNSLFYPHKEQ